MSVVPVLVGLLILFGLLGAIGLMAWDTSEQAATDGESPSPPADEAPAPTDSATTTEP